MLNEKNKHYLQILNSFKVGLQVNLQISKVAEEKDTIKKALKHYMAIDYERQG